MKREIVEGVAEGLTEEAQGCSRWLFQGGLIGAVVGAVALGFVAWKFELSISSFAGGGALVGGAVGGLGAVLLRSFLGGVGPID